MTEIYEPFLGMKEGYMQDFAGQSIGRYHIIEPLGEGGMAVVYKAYDTHLECEVAVKVIRTENLPQSGVERALKRFEREAKAVARLNHPNIVKVTDYGEEDGKPYLVMPFLPGGTLKQLIRERGQIPWQEAARILIPIAEALAYAHEEKVIHRDIKPSNILLTRSGQPMLTDFGVAKIIEDEATQDLTGTSATVGTPEYMAPEQITSKTVDARADLYSLGVVFYEMVTGRKPFEADTPMAVLVKHASEPLPRPSQYNKNLPLNIENILIKALTKKPEDRYQSADEIRKALQKLVSGAGEDEKSTGEGSPKKSQKLQGDIINKSWLRIALVSIAVIGLLGLGFLLSSLINKGIPAQQISNPTNTVLPSPSLTLEPTNTFLPTGTVEPTLTPTITMTPKPDNSFTVMVDAPLKCRQGPSEYLYPYTKVLDPQIIEVVGKNSDWSWIYFYTLSESCWTKKDLVYFQNDITNLEIVENPEVVDPIYYGYLSAICKYKKGDMYAGFQDTGWDGNKCWAEPLCYLHFTDNEGGFFVSEFDAISYGTNNEFEKTVLAIPFTKESQINNDLGISVLESIRKIPCTTSHDGTFYVLSY